jgi:phage terminase small subunit
VATTGLTPKQEAFCLAYVQTSNASEAYRRSYDVAEETKPETIWSEASRLVADPKVSARIVDLQEKAREIALVSVGSLTDELEKARSHAMADPKGAAAAVSAIMGKAKLHKLLDEEKAIAGVAVTVVIGTRDAAIL